MQDFKKLAVWQKAHLLTLAIYHATERFHADERYGLTSQLRRAAASVPTNIAEGASRNSSSDFARFLDIAMGSASELEYQLILAHDLKLLHDDTQMTLNENLSEVKRILTGLTKRVRSR